MVEIDWASLLQEGDIEGLWNGLFRLVSRHPAVRPLRFATDGAAVTSQGEINADLTQELFLELFQKQRFEHYLDSGYTSNDIENEIAHIELPNLVGERLRKRYPESFRMARRVSSLLKTSSRLRRFDIVDESERESSAEKPAPRRGRPSKKAKAAPPKEAVEDDDMELLDESMADDGAEENPTRPRRRRMVNQVFGLREWPRSKQLKDSGCFTDLIKVVPMRQRDTRIVGRTGSSQLILSNPDLEDLIVEVLEAIDSPADVRTIRQLVLSKIPLQDYNIASLDEQVNMGSSGSTLKRDAADTRETPEGRLLRQERYAMASELAYDFLDRMREAVNHNERRFTRMIATLWHCYYDPQGPSQLEIARMLGVSDSLVSDNRRLIEQELRKLNLSVEEGAVFSESLQRLVGQMVVCEQELEEIEDSLVPC